MIIDPAINNEVNIMPIDLMLKRTARKLRGIKRNIPGKNTNAEKRPACACVIPRSAITSVSIGGIDCMARAIEIHKKEIITSIIQGEEIFRIVLYMIADTPFI
jgi:hypothetical protein